MPAEVLTERGGEVKDYFVKLGYNVTWDFSTRSGEQWREIMKDRKLIAQIDMDVPLTDIIMDLEQFYLGKPGISKSDYKVNGQGEEFDEMLKKVYHSTHITSSLQTI